MLIAVLILIPWLMATEGASCPRLPDPEISMPLYFFDLHDGEDHTIDDYGMEFDHFEEARNHAVSLLPDIAREELPNGPRRDFICDIRAEGAQIVYRAVLKFREDRFEADIRLDTSAAPHARCTDDVTTLGLNTPVNPST